jgi:hypothetical protein
MGTEFNKTQVLTTDAPQERGGEGEGAKGDEEGRKTITPARKGQRQDLGPDEMAFALSIKQQKRKKRELRGPTDAPN